MGAAMLEHSFETADLEPLERASIALAVTLFLNRVEVDVYQSGDRVLLSSRSEPIDLSLPAVQTAAFRGGMHVFNFAALGLICSGDFVNAFNADKSLFEHCPAARRFRANPMRLFRYAHVQPRVFTKAAQYAAEEVADATDIRGGRG